MDGPDLDVLELQRIETEFGIARCNSIGKYYDGECRLEIAAYRD